MDRRCDESRGVSVVTYGRSPARVNTQALSCSRRMLFRLLCDTAVRSPQSAIRTRLRNLNGNAGPGRRECYGTWWAGAGRESVIWAPFAILQNVLWKNFVRIVGPV